MARELLAGLHLPLLRPPQRFLRQLAFGNVAARRLKLHEAALRVEHPAVGPFLPAGFAGRRHPAMHIRGYWAFRRKRSDLSMDRFTVVVRSGGGGYGGEQFFWSVTNV